METILGLLLILLPAVFKLLEKKLKDSGKTASAETVHEWAELFGESKDDDVVQEETPAPVVKQRPVVIEPVSPQPKTAAAPVVQKTLRKPSKPVLVEEEKAEKKEKIDPKKLVIYSEIMKPKF